MLRHSRSSWIQCVEIANLHSKAPLPKPSSHTGAPVRPDLRGMRSLYVLNSSCRKERLPHIPDHLIFVKTRIPGGFLAMVSSYCHLRTFIATSLCTHFLSPQCQYSSSCSACSLQRRTRCIHRPDVRRCNPHSMGSRRLLGAVLIRLKATSSSTPSSSPESSESSSRSACFFRFVLAVLLFAATCLDCFWTVHCASVPSMLFVRAIWPLRPLLPLSLLAFAPAPPTIFCKGLFVAACLDYSGLGTVRLRPAFSYQLSGLSAPCCTLPLLASASVYGNLLQKLSCHC